MTGEVTIVRFDPTKDTASYEQVFTYRYEQGMSVLGVLNQIYEEQDATLGYSYCCKAVKCGLCGLRVDGKPCLSCEVLAKPKMRLAPLAGFPVIKDLIVDRQVLESRRPDWQLYLQRDDAPQILPEPIDMEAFDRFKQVSRCIECYCCVSDCPIYKRDPEKFAGPCAFALEARHVFDPRDKLDRAPLLQEMGIDLCVACGRCSGVCPMNADPMGAILQMRGDKRK